MEEFDFPFHLYAVEYPDSGFKMDLGGGYSYNAEPDSPDPRVLTLTFPTMRRHEARYFEQNPTPVGALGDVWLKTGLTVSEFYRHNGSSWVPSVNRSKLNIAIEPQTNAGLLEDFYIRHRKWKKFIYNSPVYGKLETRFNRPLSLPQGVIDGAGTIEAFEVQLIEVVR